MPEFVGLGIYSCLAARNVDGWSAGPRGFKGVGDNVVDLLVGEKLVFLGSVV